MVLCCFIPVAGSSQYRSRSQDERNYHPSSYGEEDSSSFHIPTSLDDEELILSALARIEESEHVSPRSLYRPKARGIVVNYDEPQNFSSTSRRRKRKPGKRKKKRVVPKKTKAQIKDPTNVQSCASPRQSLPHVPALEDTTTKETVKEVLYREQEKVEGEACASVVSINTIRSAAATYHVPSRPVLTRRQPSQAAVMPGSSNASPNNPPVQSKDVNASPTTPWVRRYLNARPKDVLLPVPKEYIADGFNLAQLAPIVERIGFQVMGPQAVDIAKRLVELPPPQPSYPIYRLALQLLLNENENDEAGILLHPLIPPEAIQQASEALYLMIHARFVISPRGLDALRRILLNSPVFGKCPRILCDGTILLPYGASNDYSTNAHVCQRYCPCCGNLWNCWESKTDGCAWGPSLCYLLLMTHGHELFPAASRHQPPPVMNRERVHHPTNPAVFGFRIHPAATWGRPVSI